MPKLSRIYVKVSYMKFGVVSGDRLWHPACVKPKTEEFLYHLLWSCDKLMRPTFRNVGESFEAWCYRNGFARQIAELQRRKLVEFDAESRAVKLTTAGQLHAMGGCDPEARWKRSWDGLWRMVTFDFPVRQNSTRDSLRLQLLKRRFGLLQKSVWITPDPLQEERKLLEGSRVNAGVLLLLESRPCAGESDEDIVGAAWDFDEINAAYAEHSEVLAARPTKPTVDSSSAEALRQWAQQERLSWAAAIERDPFLPERLLPADYMGRKSLRARLKSFRKIAGQLMPIREFGEPPGKQG